MQEPTKVRTIRATDSIWTVLRRYAFERSITLGDALQEWADIVSKAKRGKRK
jgi:hypothetical protein